jgi:hypothetical protein
MPYFTVHINDLLTMINTAFILWVRMNALDKAIKAAGGPQKLAQALDVTPMAISQWKKRGVPPERAVDIEIAVKGKVTRYQLRPELFGRRDAIR